MKLIIRFPQEVLISEGATYEVELDPEIRKLEVTDDGEVTFTIEYPVVK